MFERTKVPLRVSSASLFLAAALLLPSAGSAETWHLARGPSTVGFTVGHLVFSEVRGRFGRFEGTVECSGKDFEEARVAVAIDVASVYTGHTDRDRELLGEEFFAADRFPEMRFESRSIEATGSGSYRLIGDLTLRGITQEVALEVRSERKTRGSERGRHDFRATGSIRRSDFGITWNDTWAGRLILNDRVDIELDIALEPTG